MQKITSSIIKAPNLIEFEQAIQKAGSESLVVFDIDEVIFTSKDQVLHPNYKQYRDIIEADLAKNLSETEFVALISLVYKMRARIIVDLKILKIFELLSNKNIMTIALTHCPTGNIGTGETFEELRTLQLNSFKVDFDRLSNYLGEIKLPELKQDYGVPLLHRGVILTGLVDKGTVLEQILNRIEFKPKEIIFIDDRLENIISVQSMCEKLGINYTGFEYSAVKDTSVTEFNEHRDKFQFDSLAKKRLWLGDVDADEEMLKSTK